MSASPSLSPEPGVRFSNHVAAGEQVQQEDDEQPIDNAGSIFPPPPKQFYNHYTFRNLELAKQLKATGSFTLQENETRPDFDLFELVEPPNLDWIQEDGSWTVFGETWPIDEKMPTLQDMGVRQLYPSGSDRRESLQRLLQAFIRIYLAIIDTLLKPPPSKFAMQNNLPSDLLRLCDNLRLVAINMHHLLNELRPVQARESLLRYMRLQIEERKQKTQVANQKCDVVQDTIAKLKSKYETKDASEDITMGESSSQSKKIQLDPEAQAFSQVLAAVDAIT